MSSSNQNSSSSQEQLYNYLGGQLESLASQIDWLNGQEIRSSLVEFSERVTSALKDGKKIMLFGNGGSAAEASHVAGEFVSKCVIDAGAWPAIALNDATASMTAIANDFGYESVFSRQILAFASKGDVVIALSTSGSSPNIVQGLRAARSIGCLTSLWTSIRCLEGEDLADLVLKVPTNSTPRAQEVHLFLGHLLAELCALQLVLLDT